MFCTLITFVMYTQDFLTIGKIASLVSALENSYPVRNSVIFTVANTHMIVPMQNEYKLIKFATQLNK